MHKLTIYRKSVAQFLLVWICAIITSGVVFMHKEVTSTGLVVTHIHPYNLGEKKHHKHQSDDEIRFLDIVFQGSYINWDPVTYSEPLPQVIIEISYADKQYLEVHKTIYFKSGRAPPIHLA